MPENVKPGIDSRFAPALERLGQAFAGEPWALTYMAEQAERCLDDALRVARLRPGARVLNIGGAPYVFDMAARELGLEVHALDIDPQRNRAAIDALDLCVAACDIEAPGSETHFGGFDVICLCEVIEHLRIDLIGTLRRIRDAMAPGALLYLTTPNFHYAPSLVRMLRQRRSGPPLVAEWRKLGDLGHMGHVREYARGELEELFVHCGFRVEQVIARNSHGARSSGFGPMGLARRLARHCDGLAQDFVFLLTPEQAR